jgi:hypothetical protein
MRDRDRWENCRWAECLIELLDSYGTWIELRANWEYDYQGFVDVDILLPDGRVFSYKYYYGSCTGCDPWEDCKTTDEIKQEMKDDATFFR